MTKFLVVFDVDSTLIEDEVIELLADVAGSGAQVKEITDRAMAGEIDFSQSLLERVSTLEGLPVAVFDKVLAKIKPTQGVGTLIRAIHEAGGLVGAVSGGFTQLLDPLATQLKLDFKQANELEIIDGRLTGRVTGQIVDASVKRDCLLAWAQVSGVSLEQTVAVGDGANDLLMMAASGLSIAFNAKPVVKQSANLVVQKQNLEELLPVLGL
ncbi:MAG: phosphoserine phosphatase SerB [Micrococcales bacterium]